MNSDLYTKTCITLIKPPAVECFRFATTSITPPLGLAYIAGALEKAGYHPHVIDAVAQAPATHRRYIRGYLVGLPFDDIVARIPFDARIVGISAIFTHEWPAIAQLAKLIRARFPDITIIIGGEHVTSMPEFSLATSEADILVLGEGEETLIELLAALDASAPLDSIKGIAYRKEDGAIHVAQRRGRRTDIDAIPLPAWHYFDLKQYHKYNFCGGLYSSGLSVPILATRGCPYQCTYCSAPNMWTPSWIPRSPAKVADEIQYYVEHLGAKNFPFQDLTAIVKREWIVEFCNEIINRKLDITWQLPSGTRSEAIDEEVAELLRRSGMINMAYAPESGDEKTRQMIKKKMHTDNLVKSIEAAAKAELNVSIFLVIGFPHDSVESIRENLKFAERMASLKIQDVSVGFYMALPGTELFYALYKNGHIRIDREYFTHILASNSLLPAASFCENMSRLDLLYWKLRIFLRFYLYKSKLSKTRRRRMIKSVLLGMIDLDHQTKLQSALRNGIRSLFYSLASYFKPRWIERSKEAAFFADWDAIYAQIRRHDEQTGRWGETASDYTKLHQSNVIKALKTVHSSENTVKLSA